MGSSDSDDLPPEGFDRALLRRLIRYLRPHRATVAAAVTLLLLHAGLVLVGPILTERALDHAIPNRDRGLLAQYAALFVGALVTTAVVEYGEAQLTVRAAPRGMFDLRHQIFTHLQPLSVP